jgi:alpha-galactosidase
MKRYLYVLAVSVLMASNTFAQKTSQKVSAQSGSPDFCSARLTDETLILENSRISRTYTWNKGNLITKTITDKQTGKTWTSISRKPDMSFPGQPSDTNEATFSSGIVPETPIKPEHLEAIVLCKSGSLEIKRIFRIYPGCPAIACDVYLRGKAEKPWVQQTSNPGDLQNIEKLTESANAEFVPVLEKLELPGKHWKLDAIEFLDVTDRFNTLIRETHALSYRENIFRGNLLFATDLISQDGLFVLKESPASSVQLAYPGGDFLSNFGNIRMIGVGMQQTDLDQQQWKKAYGFVTGVYGGGEIDKLLALRDYQQRIRIHQPNRDEMILMNTWGDRGQDAKINEAFCLAELEAGARLGITRFQIDDGWQSGKSPTAVPPGVSFDHLLSSPDYWKLNPGKFPNGLTPIIEKGKELGIEICLWFVPCPEESYANCEKDAETLISLYRQYGIRTFKIDGVKMPDKTAEINFRKILDKVVAATNGEVVFNLDVTAGRRGGYHFFNEYGNIFLENRYTDSQNYYPYWTLRNLWMLSHYVPPQNLQIEFLNKWRNVVKYGDDPYAPNKYSFDYLFAITMAAQPLAWFEGSNLPKEAFAVSPTIGSYKKVMTDFHSGVILPIGDEPSGKNWTGFQSQQIGNNKGYVLVFRELNDFGTKEFTLPLLSAGTYRFEPIAGNGHVFKSKTGTDKKITFAIEKPNSFAFYRYEKIN